MMVTRRAFSKGFIELSRMVTTIGFLLAIPSLGMAQIKWIRTPADVTASQKDLYPPSYYGYALDVTNPSYFGGGNYTHNYAYTRGTGVADFPGNVPGPRQIPDRRPVFTSYPENGEFYVRAGQVVPETTLNPSVTGRFQVEVPPEAQVWIEGKPTNQVGAQRAFASPPLQPGKTYLYEIKARWLENGKPIEQTQTIALQIGTNGNVKFPIAPPANFPMIQEAELALPH